MKPEAVAVMILKSKLMKNQLMKSIIAAKRLNCEKSFFLFSLSIIFICCCCRVRHTKRIDIEVLRSAAIFKLSISCASNRDKNNAESSAAESL